MKKLSILVVTLMAFTACHNADVQNVKASGVGVGMSEQEHEDFQNMLKERSGYNSIFKAVKSDIADAWDAMLDIFGDYVVEDVFVDSLLSVDTNGSYSFGGYSENDGEFYY